jgi:hypothetical protein
MSSSFESSPIPENSNVPKAEQRNPIVEEIEKELSGGNLKEARDLLNTWILKGTREYGYGVPEHIQSEHRRLSAIIRKKEMEEAIADSLAARRAKWMSPEIEWSAQSGSRDRPARLLVRAPDKRLYWFSGNPVEGVTIIASEFMKQGRWSHREYRLGVQSGFATIPMTDGFNSGKIIGGLGVAVGLSEMATAGEIASVLDVPPEEVEKLMTR